MGRLLVSEIEANLRLVFFQAAIAMIVYLQHVVSDSVSLYNILDPMTP